ncbi:hypothetical protein PFICI_00495 [Pestalotiopsis fici W106-1]|uniref:Glucose-methanol-choline oxidoreductase N-terminal domain-containing protein n=1 Tax=Pestalotiopsis fici (strain W106-1 / CGMCC3.15140) TaxID=1229662 RepID=W3XMF1_PESFW|nr:uncharacterized protein PFICI_00495 [Pestalotiopsis fici W106-1]ETS86667.1 hypothetical protein PFICI_00495 [Pestalotiopsis fici W106-1]
MEMEQSTHDVIIVGGGTAGCLLASRLSSQLPHLDLLLLEAGENHNEEPKVLTPLISRRMFGDPAYDWCFETTAQPGLGGRTIQQTRGRMIGGSSGINSHSLVYPNKAMHDTWAELVGSESWSWANMAKFYQAFQSEQPPSEATESTDTTPKIQASYPTTMNSLQRAWEDVFNDLGAASQKSGVSGEAIGGVTTTNAIDRSGGKGRRSFAGNTFLNSATIKKNLQIESSATVVKMVLEDSSNSNFIKRVGGVVYERQGRSIFAKARKEVILCAGVFGSPQILELSGIGNPRVLETVGVHCTVNLPEVGENLQDHINFGPSIEVEPTIETMDVYARDPAVLLAHSNEYQEHQTGPLSEGAAYSFAYWPLQLFNSKSDQDELHALLDSLATSPRSKGLQLHHEFSRRMILDPEEASATVFMTRMQRYTLPGHKAPGNYMTVVAMLAHPFSRGSVHIATPESSDPPVIDCGYLTHPLDAEILALHVSQIERLVTQPTFASIMRPGGRRLPPGLESAPSLSEIKESIKTYGATNYHPCGTCAMMRAEYGGVVDEELRVRGVENLRICDASIFPIIPRGNILTTVYAVAEKGAEMLVGLYGPESLSAEMV